MNERPAPSTVTGDLASRLDGELIGAGDLRIRTINAVDAAGADEITFALTDSYVARFASSDAGAMVMSRSSACPSFDHKHRAVIRVDDVEQAMIDLLEYFEPEKTRTPGIHASAHIAPGAHVPSDASIGPFVTIEDGASLGRRVTICAGARIGREVMVGDETVIHENAVICDRCSIGSRVVIHNGASIGADGFNYRPTADRSGLRRVPHLGTVKIEDEVEIGANACVDRGKFGASVVGRGTKIDNLVQVGHNCRIGRHVVIAGGAAIAGSVTIDDWAQIGGLCAIAEHAHIGAGARLAGMSGIMTEVKPGESVFGSPSTPIRAALRQHICLRRLPGWMEEVGKRLDRLDGGLSSQQD